MSRRYERAPMFVYCRLQRHAAIVRCRCHISPAFRERQRLTDAPRTAIFAFDLYRDAPCEQHARMRVMALRGARPRAVPQNASSRTIAPPAIVERAGKTPKRFTRNAHRRLFAICLPDACYVCDHIKKKKKKTALWRHDIAKCCFYASWRHGRQQRVACDMQRAQRLPRTVRGGRRAADKQRGGRHHHDVAMQRSRCARSCSRPHAKPQTDV